MKQLWKGAILLATALVLQGCATPNFIYDILPPVYEDRKSVV